MNKRSQFLYNLTGTILCRTSCQASPPSKYAGQTYYKLKITQPNQTTKTLQVFQDKLTNSQIWAAIEQKQYSKQNYLFKCLNFRGFYYLVDWEEMSQQAPKEVPE